MMTILLVFLFIIYCILEAFKYGKSEFTEEVSKKRNIEYYKEIKVLNRRIVYLKCFIFSVFFILLLVNHFLDELSKSSGIKGFLMIVVVSIFFMFICILDIVKIRRNK